VRRAPILIALIVTALAPASSASSALADDPAAPTITLLAPTNGTPVILDEKHAPTFSWKIDYPATPSNPVIFFQLSTDPTFQGQKYSESRVCDAANPACFTSLKAASYWWYSSTGGKGAPPKGEVTLYWRVTVTYSFAHDPAASDPRTLKGGGAAAAAPDKPNVPVVPDSEAPRLSVDGAAANRGEKARILFHVWDNQGVVTTTARLLYQGHVLARTTTTLTNVSWSYTYVYWFRVPKWFRLGTYSACIAARDRAKNSVQRCAPVRVRR
jgi:hypothetical protein